MQEMYDGYEMAFTNFNKVTNMQKHIDNIFTGSIKYLTLLRDALTKELNSSEHYPNPKQHLEFIMKMKDEIVSVQMGLKNRSTKIAEALQKEVEERIKTGSLSGNGSKSKQIKGMRDGSPTPGSPSKLTSKQTKDAFETELQTTESKISNTLM